MQRQKGITLIGFMMICLLICFFGLIAMRLTPIYIRHFNIRQSLHALEKQSFWNEGEMMNEFEVKTQVRKTFERYLEVNEVRSISARDLDIKLKPGQGFEVSLSYDEQTPLFFNIELLIHFDEKVSLNR